MSDLTDFLLARIAEDESFALSAQAEASIYDAGSVRWHWLVAHSKGSRWHPTTFDPTRVLAESEAKRRIVEWMSDEVEYVVYSGEVLRALAAVYADHPDYRDEWRS